MKLFLKLQAKIYASLGVFYGVISYRSGQMLAIMKADDATEKQQTVNAVRARKTRRSGESQLGQRSGHTGLGALGDGLYRNWNGLIYWMKPRYCFKKYHFWRIFHKRIGVSCS